MQEDRAKQPPKAHEDEYRNERPIERKQGEKRQDKSSPDDPTAGRLDEHRHRPGKESRDET